MAAATDAVQMNVRLDRSLKREGDAALAEAGYTPSQAVRAVWELAVRLRNQPGRLRKLLEKVTPKPMVTAEGDAEKGEVMAPDLQLQQHLQRAKRVELRMASLGINPSAPWDDDDNELLMQALFERHWEEHA